jgi:hypothetical protein
MNLFETALQHSRDIAAPIDRERILFLRDSVMALTIPALTDSAKTARLLDLRRKFAQDVEREAE